jgi:branched-chain amino acid transport system ATP-binding protein
MTAQHKGPLQTQALTKRYGGLLATDNVSLSLANGELHAIIGPNGAGKTTLIGQLGGELQPDSGDVFLEGSRVTALPAAERALRGLARSYQISSAFPEFTVLECVALAKQAHAGHSFGAWRSLLQRTQLVDPAEHAIAQAGLSHRISQRVSDLAHGERRQLELAMVLVGNPKVLLLDEPMAGMSHQESMKVVDLLAGLKGRYTLLLVEHDMQAVFALADTISVLVNGAIIASGLPQEIRENPVVRTAYLGDEELPE